MTETLATDDDREELDLLLRGFQVSRMLRLIADLGIADKIPADGQVMVKDIAAACAVLPEPMLRVLRALAAFRIFEVAADGSVSHTPRSRLLRTDTPNSLHHAARFWTGPGSWGAWNKLDVAMTGGTPHEAAWSIGRFAYLKQHPDEARLFDAMMANFPDNRHAAVAAAYDFSGAGLIADIGGGNGAALRQILTRFSTPRGLVFDREDVITAVTPDDLMEGRITAQGGSFFDQVPAGADIYMLIRVLHDWPDEDCLRILRVCRAAMGGPQARLLLGEQILEPDPARGRATGYLIDVQMMTMFGHARARSVAEFRDLFAQSGFWLRQVIPTASPVSIIEAAPIADPF
ncbi:methyltransferase [Mesorhizobium sp. 113-3-3]|uniref:methyltransferase n=1 Tax=Mesorhizobium sp. 113-3-3 TaxID=2744516 RepID=UPI001928EC6B|nr:methyltransferase [Mesorhizobium sp. 113-3-3]BCG83117.1 methyltransferase [Mesorhizobium sp. 113-3-3]